MKRFWQVILVLMLVAAHGWAFNADVVPDAMAEGVPGQGRTYRIGMVPWVGWTPLHVAAEKGMWKELGLDIEVVSYAHGVLMHDALVLGELDFSMNMAVNCIGIQGHGIPVSILGAVDWSHGGDIILLKKGVELEELRGRPLGVYVDYGGLHYFLHEYLQTRDMDLKDFRVVAMPPTDLVDQFVLDRVEGVVLFDPYARHAAQLGNGVPVTSSAEFPGVIPEVIFGLAALVETIPEADVVALLRGWIRAVRWMHDPANRDELSRIINDHVFAGLADFSESEIDGFLSEVMFFLPGRLAEYNLEKGGFPAFLTKAGRFMYRIGKADAVYAADDMFHPHFLRKALRLEAVGDGR